MNKKASVPLLLNKEYLSPSVFLPENLLREARRQKSIPDGPIPEICVLDPDGDLATYLLKSGKASLVEFWACYHSRMYTFSLDSVHIGILPCIVGAPYAVNDGPLAVTIPVGATQLQLGINDDIYFDNSGALLVDVSGPGVAAAPEPATLTLLGIGVAGMAGYGWRRRKTARPWSQP